MQHQSTTPRGPDQGRRGRKEQTLPPSINFSRRLPQKPLPALPSSPPSSYQTWKRRDKTPSLDRDKTPSLGRDSTSTVSSDAESAIFSHLDDAQDINWDMTSSSTGAPRLQMRRTSSSCSRLNDYRSKHVDRWLQEFPVPVLDTRKHKLGLADGHLIERPLAPLVFKGTGRKVQKQQENMASGKHDTPLTLVVRQAMLPLVPRAKDSAPKYRASPPTLHEPATIQRPRRAPPPPSSQPTSPPLSPATSLPVRDHLADYDPDLGMVVRSHWDDSDDESDAAGDGRRTRLQRTREVWGRMRSLTNATRAGSTSEGTGQDNSGRNTAASSRTPSLTESRLHSRAPSRASSQRRSAGATMSRPERQVLPLVAPPSSYIAPRLTRDKGTGPGSGCPTSASAPSLLRRAVHRVAGSH